MKIDLLVAEIGSTTTLINAFDLGGNPSYLGQGQSPTTVLEGDVNIGLERAIVNLKEELGSESLEYKELMATSSAAGGLQMTVHGLVYDMTVKAAREAALGAGANIRQVTAGRLRETDLKKLKEINPSIILLAGGVDYGERETALYNGELIKSLDLKIPLIYAGNIENQDEIREIFKDSSYELFLVDNVYPRIDELNIGPTRRIIQDIFEKYIIHAEGMENIRSLVSGNIMPTPGAVMMASRILYDEIGDLLTIDVGGATTDIHSVSHGSEEISKILMSPEPFAKRTVEGDLGVYLNYNNILDLLSREEISKDLSLSLGELDSLMDNYQAIPISQLEKSYVKYLSFHAAREALYRHGGSLRYIYGPGGKQALAQGKDLTKVKHIIGTGGPLTRLRNMERQLERLIDHRPGNYLLPDKSCKILIDKEYIMASLGVMSKKHPNQALKLLKKSLGLEVE